MIKLIFTFFSILFLFFINSCSPVGVLASGGVSTMVVAEGNRSLGTVIDDTTLKLNISSKFLQSDNNIFINVNTNIIEGRVLLTGIVDTQEIRIDTVRTVWQVEGVKEVINEIEVGNKTSIKEYANDLWINTQARTKATKNIGLRGLSYNFETIKGKIYITGITSNKEELQSIIEGSKTIKGVKEIINYVIVKE